MYLQFKIWVPHGILGKEPACRDGGGRDEGPSCGPCHKSFHLLSLSKEDMDVSFEINIGPCVSTKGSLCKCAVDTKVPPILRLSCLFPLFMPQYHASKVKFFAFILKVFFFNNFLYIFK